MTDISTNLTIILPAGIVLPFAGTGASPEGWELCNGQSVSKTSDKYSKLFAAIGITYGDDGGNFKLPGLNNENLFIRGGTTGFGSNVADSTKASGISVGNQSTSHAHTLSSGTISASAATHTHTTADATHSHTGASGNTDPGLKNHTHGFSGTLGGGHLHTLKYRNMAGSITPSTGDSLAYSPSTSTTTVFNTVDGVHLHPAGTTGYPSATPYAPHSHTVSVGGGGNHTHTVNGNGSHGHSGSVSTLTLNNQSASHNHTLTGDAETAPKHIKMQYIIKL